MGRDEDLAAQAMASPSARSAPYHIHASAVAWDSRALLISGPSGAGKSALALDLIALGCRLIADDTVVLMREAGQLCAAPVETTRNLIEIRGLGLVPVEAASAPIPVVAEIDLGAPPPERLPRAQRIERLGVDLPLLSKPLVPNPASALLVFLQAGRVLPT